MVVRRFEVILRDFIIAFSVVLHKNIFRRLIKPASHIHLITRKKNIDSV